MNSVLAVFVLFAIKCCCARLVPYSPCPELFNYFESQTWEIFGAMTLKNDLSGEYNLRVNMSIPTKTDKTIAIRKVTSDDDITQGKGIEYYVTFPFNHTWPVMREVVHNGITYCSGPPASGDEVTEVSATHHFKVTINPDVLEKNRPKMPSGPPKFPVPSKFTTNCGEPDPTISLLRYAKPTKRGEYPWLVAMFYYDDSAAQYGFRCASTLVTEKHVITAAHCVRNGDYPISKDQIELVLGKHNIKVWLKQSQLRDVQEIYVHPDYTTPSDGDIAIMLMSSPVRFSVTIKPVCLWFENEDLEFVVGIKGTVVGWGKDEKNNEFVEDARQLELPIVSTDVCLSSDHRFSLLTSNKTFCAGKLDGSGPCTGDSGGGFLVKRNGKWTLRGIVSAGLINSNTKTCDSYKYTVFTDVPLHAEWILSILN